MPSPVRWAILVASCCGCAAPLDWRERQAELIGRIADANRVSGYDATLTDHTSPLDDGVHRARLELRHPWLVGLPQPLDITCFDATPARRRHPARPPRCRLETLPPFDARTPSREASELVAIVAPARAALGRDVQSYRVTQRALGDGGSLLVVHAKEGRVAFDVHCGSDDPARAPRACRVERTAPPVELDEAAHPGARLERCGARGWAPTVLVPADAVASLPIDRAQLQMRAVARAPHVRSVGFGPCCPTVGRAECLTAHVEPRANLDDAAAALADVRPEAAASVREPTQESR